MIVIDIEKAKTIFKSKIRLVRDPLLAKLDLEYMRATEESNTKRKKEIVDKKEQLRNLPNDPSIDTAKTIEELSTLWNEELLGKRPW